MYSKSTGIILLVVFHYSCVSVYHDLRYISLSVTLVAANITKLLETKADKQTFPLVCEWNFPCYNIFSCSVYQSSGRQPVEKGDEKKLIGYAQLSVIGSVIGSTV